MITIKPVNGQQVEIEAEGQSFGQFYSADAVEAMEALHAEYPGQCQLIIKNWGFKAQFAVVEKALDLAGLNDLKERANASNSSKVVF